MSGPKFELGVLLATPELMEAVPQGFILECFSRHASGDYGDLCCQDKALNDEAVREGSRILSKYCYGGVDFYIETAGVSDGGRENTTAYLTSQY